VAAGTECNLSNMVLQDRNSCIRSYHHKLSSLVRAHLKMAAPEN
jgi:hypothetical protein